MTLLTYTPEEVEKVFPLAEIKPVRNTAGYPQRPQAGGEPIWIELFRKLGLNPLGPKAIDGGTQYEMLCLRDHTHTIQGDATGMWATFWPDNGLRYWGCRHAHCDGLGVPDWVAIARERGLEVPSLRPPAEVDPGVNLWPSEAPSDAQGFEWPEPLPLVSKVEAKPYPMEALPEPIRSAVTEVQAFVQAPHAMVASSALAAVALAVQAHWDIERAEKLDGPTSLFLLTIADSGERKSSCDGFFTKVIREYEQREADEAKPRLADYRADRKSWEARCRGLEDAIKTASKSGKGTCDHEQALRELSQKEPQRPRVPRLLYGDATPESLKWQLASGWPSGGVVSSEAGLVFGSHGMGSESVMRHMATLNILWDGTAIQTERRSSESFTVRGARFSMFLQVQELTLRLFMDSSKDIGRGSGFFARCLIGWPESTIGSRPFRDAPPNWPALAAFNNRLELILNEPVPIHEEGYLVPGMLKLTPEAKEVWVAFHDAIERDLGSGGLYHDVKDVAAKTADNATRLAGLFHAFGGSIGGVVSADNLRAGCKIAEWHLTEARRFFGELALPAALADAARLESWLVSRCKNLGLKEIPTKEVQQYGPNGLRDKAKLDPALDELVELGRAMRITHGRRKLISLNPVILASRGGATATPAIPATPEAAPPRPPVISSGNSNNSGSSVERPESGYSYSEDL
jgi:putative DNA primase/helicase